MSNILPRFFESYFKDKFGNLIHRWRDRQTGKFAKKPQFYRVSVALNFVEKHQYYGSLYQQWFTSKEEAEDAVEEMKERVIQETEDFLHYDREEFWFDWQVGIGVQESDTLEEDYFDIEEH